MRRAILTALACIAALSGCSGNKSTSPTQPGPGGSTNHSPAVSINTSSTLLTYGGKATISVQATDVDWDQLPYTYSAKGGTIASSGTTATTATYTAGNQYGPASATTTVTDGKGGSTSATANMYIHNPNPPHMTFGTTVSSSCGYGTPNPNGYILTITPAEAVTITEITLVSRGATLGTQSSSLPARSTRGWMEAASHQIVA